MLLNPDLSPDLAASCARRGLRASASAGALALLTACGAPLPSPGAQQAARQSAAPAVFSILMPDSAPPAPPALSGPQASPTPSASDAPASAAAAHDPEAVMRLLAYADRVRALSPSELAQEAARLGNPPAPAEQLQLALVLSQMRQTPELIRAQELLARVLANAQAQPLHPLARLLAARYSEQRRLEDQLDRQTQQTREVQRKLDQTHERLEALKAIERSLTNRPPAAAPASRSRPTAP